ncbi:MAG TPA: spore coat U domain-containing protein [Kofleriaceae bacterium]|jgi:spore coat protein U-like protein
MRAAVVAASVLLMTTLARSAEASCSIQSISGIAFGTYDTVGGGAVDMTGTMYVTCTALSGFSIDVGAGNSGSALQRYMKSGTTQMLYNLFVDLAHTLIWGDGNSGTSHYSSIGTGLSVPVTIFGEIKAHQDLPIGSYTDTTISVTVNF